MADAGEGLIDIADRFQDRMDDHAREKSAVVRSNDRRDPEQVRTIESLRLARADLDRQLALSTSNHRRTQLLGALAEIDRRVESAAHPRDTKDVPSLLLQAVIVPENQTSEGQLIAAV